jgi:nucleotide-binding universal stress UspA family protein
MAESARPLDVEIRIAHGEPSLAILEELGATPYTLVLLGVHRSTGIERLLIRNVVDRVLRSAPCPVLTVRSAVS